MAPATIGPDKVNQLRTARFLAGRLQDHMASHAQILRPKFDLVEDILTSELEGLEIAEWTRPEGGYFVFFEHPAWACKSHNCVGRRGRCYVDCGRRNFSIRQRPRRPQHSHRTHLPRAAGSAHGYGRADRRAETHKRATAPRGKHLTESTQDPSTDAANNTDASPTTGNTPPDPTDNQLLDRQPEADATAAQGNAASAPAHSPAAIDAPDQTTAPVVADSSAVPEASGRRGID